MEQGNRPRSYALAFVLGFAACALLVRFLLPLEISAAPAAGFAISEPARVVAAVRNSVVSVEGFAAPAPAVSPSLLPRMFPGPAAAVPDTAASGVVLSPDGLIVTNEHVVAGMARLRVRLVGGREYSSRVVGRDRRTDLALLRIDARSLQPAPVGDSRRLRAGDPVVAIGNPLGLENSVSLGVVSAVRSAPLRLDGRVLGEMLQTDAAINQGSSGGGLFNAEGRLIGINTAIITPRGATGSIGIGFAIPTHRMQPIVAALLARGRVARPWLGVRYTPAALPAGGAPGPGEGGLQVYSVLPGSPADRAGLRTADVVRQLGDCLIRTSDDLFAFSHRYLPGDRVRVRVLREGKEEELTVVLGERPS